MLTIILLAVLLLAMIVMIAGIATQAHADAMQAQAAIEAARAAQIAAGGQAVSMLALVVAFGFVLLVLTIIVGYLLYQRNKPEPQSKWAPGPNARWARWGRERLDAAPPPAMQGDIQFIVQHMVQLELLRYLQRINTPAFPPQASNFSHFSQLRTLPGDDPDEPLW